MTYNLKILPKILQYLPSFCQIAYDKLTCQRLLNRGRRRFFEKKPFVFYIYYFLYFSQLEVFIISLGFGFGTFLLSTHFSATQ